MVAITKSLCFSFIVLAFFATLFAVADARRIYVGGNGVWAVNPQESYNTWAGRNRFQVNDTLYFKYAKGSDSVQRVMNVDFDGCNIRNPLQSFDNGEAEVTLNRSGPFYFISGNQDHCFKGQKLIVVVLAVRNHPTPVPISPANPPKSHSPVSPIAPAKPPSTAQPPKSHSPVSPIAPAKPPSTAQPPKSPSPVSPIAPAKAPSTAQPPKSPSPVSPISPAKSPKSPSPVSPISPVSAPSTSHPPKSSFSPTQPPPSSSPVTHSPAVTPSHAPTMSPATPSPPKSPSPSTSSPANPPTSSPSPSESTPTSDNIKAPAPSPKNAAGGAAVTSVMSTVLSVAFTVLIFA